MTVSVRGISSGIDINGIIDELMQLERQPIRRKEALIERTEQITELWREVNTRFNTLNRTLPPLLDKLTFTAPVPRSSNEEVLTVKVSGTPGEASYRFNVNQLATYHSVSMDPPTVGSRISSPYAALDLFGTFSLGAGRPAEGLGELNFDEGTGSWLRGNAGSGFQAVIAEGEGPYFLNPESLTFDDDYLPEGFEHEDVRINVYMNAFTDAAGGDLSGELEEYFTEKGWAVDLQEPLFVISHNGAEWVALNQGGDPFAFLGDHPLGTFDLRAEIVDGSVEEDGDIFAINNLDFAIRSSVDESDLITVREGDSLLAIADKVNARSEQTGVRASVVMPGEGDYRLILESLSEGKDGYIQAYDYAPLDGDTARYGNDSILTTLNLLSGDSNAAGPVYNLVTEEALDAEFTLNGLQMVRSSNSFTNAIPGVEITLAGTGQATVDLAPDVDAAVEEIMLFVDAVNEANSYLRILQKDGEGPLQGSGDLMRIERQLRSLIHGMVPDIPGSSHLREALIFRGSGSAAATATGTYTGPSDQLQIEYRVSGGEGFWRNNTDGSTYEPGEDIYGLTISIAEDSEPGHGDTLTLRVNPPTAPLAYNSFASIGIMAADEEGILEIDEAKLRSALSADPEGIYQLFARETPPDSGGVTRGPDGLARQLNSMVRSMLSFNGVVQSRQDHLSRQVTRYQDRIEMLERRLELREQRLVRQFTFMEQYIARIQEQTGLMASFEMMMQNRNE